MRSTRRAPAQRDGGGIVTHLAWGKKRRECFIQPPAPRLLVAKGKSPNPFLNSPTGARSLPGEGGACDQPSWYAPEVPGPQCVLLQCVLLPQPWHTCARTRRDGSTFRPSPVLDGTQRRTAIARTAVGVSVTARSTADGLCSREHPGSLCSESTRHRAPQCEVSHTLARPSHLRFLRVPSESRSSPCARSAARAAFTVASHAIVYLPAARSWRRGVSSHWDW